ncbi:hypothetical protein ACFCVY_23470 [Streptomyces sp. NPDC056411]|uniref:hypothetical protein n=1 Tax=Streptomyces sp. NPDC056411 TaxID=3345813 RepID=UPI0035D68CFD
MHDRDHVPAADDPDFARLVDRALDSDEVKDALRRSDTGLDTEALRTLALRARAAVTATADAEYRGYLRLRTAAPAVPTVAPEPPPQQPGTPVRAGAGVLPALGVLVPALAATAAALFLLLGFGLRALGLSRRLADELVRAGFTATGVAAATALCGLVWLLVTAARNRSAAAADPLPEAPDPDPALARAHEAWQQAVLERGVIPFLLGRLDGPHREAPRPDGPAGSCPGPTDHP